MQLICYSLLWFIPCTFYPSLTPAEHPSNCNVWQEVIDFFILSYFSYILCFQRLAQSIPVITWELTHFFANIFKCKQYLLVCTVQDEYGASLCHLMWLSSESFRAWLCLRTQGWIFYWTCKQIYNSNLVPKDVYEHDSKKGLLLNGIILCMLWVLGKSSQSTANFPAQISIARLDALQNNI